MLFNYFASKYQIFCFVFVLLLKIFTQTLLSLTDKKFFFFLLLNKNFVHKSWRNCFPLNLWVIRASIVKRKKVFCLLQNLRKVQKVETSEHIMFRTFIRYHSLFIKVIELSTVIHTVINCVCLIRGSYVRLTTVYCYIRSVLSIGLKKGN